MFREAVQATKSVLPSALAARPDGEEHRGWSQLVVRRGARAMPEAQQQPGCRVNNGCQ